jgi:hypothetical protein
VCESSIEFYPLARQLDLDLSIASRLPTGHYSTKNGYLIAVAQGAGCIYETDNDNTPLQNWSSRTEETDAFSVLDSGWANVYQFFSNSSLASGRAFVAANVITCYEALVNAGFFHHDEINLPLLWIHDMRDALKKSHSAAVPS